MQLFIGLIAKLFRLDRLKDDVSVLEQPPVLQKVKYNFLKCKIL